MRKFALAMALVLAFSSAAMAIDFASTSMTIEGKHIWKNGVLDASQGKDSRTLKLSSSGTGWKALAEFVMATDKNKEDMKANEDIKLDDFYFSTTEQPFKLEVWGWGEDQNNDYETPLWAWVEATDDAPGANWEARVTANILGQETVFSIENDKTSPVYYLFSKRNLGVATVGGAYKTNFKHSNIIDGWVESDLGLVKVTGEAALVKSNDKDPAELRVGAQGVFDFGLTVKGYRLEDSEKTYVEVFQLMPDELSKFLGSYTAIDDDEAKTIKADVRVRASKDQTINDIWNVDNDWFDVNDSGDNDWLKNKGWAVGAELQKVTGDAGKDTLIANAFYQPLTNAKVLATVTKVMAKAVNGDTTDVDLRGYYDVNGKLSLHPRAFIDIREAAGNDATKLGGYAIYKINKGQLMVGYWNEKKESADKADMFLELGYSISF